MHVDNHCVSFYEPLFYGAGRSSDDYSQLRSKALPSSFARRVSHDLIVLPHIFLVMNIPIKLQTKVQYRFIDIFQPIQFGRGQKT